MGHPLPCPDCPTGPGPAAGPQEPPRCRPSIRRESGESQPLTMPPRNQNDQGPGWQAAATDGSPEQAGKTHSPSPRKRNVLEAPRLSWEACWNLERQTPCKVTKAGKQASCKGPVLQGSRPRSRALVSKANAVFLKCILLHRSDYLYRPNTCSVPHLSRGRGVATGSCPGHVYTLTEEKKQQDGK